MPTWGLTERQRTSEGEAKGPWGLHPLLLEPAKVTTDPIHGDVYTTWLEQLVVDSPPFQRLRRVRQLGTTHLVYPGATHSRFAHALGTLRVAQDLLDAVLTQREGRHPVPDLVDEWRRDNPHAAERHVARAIVVARLGALLHDIGHIPFGHSLEDDLKVLVEHDANESRFLVLWKELAGAVRRGVEQDPHFAGHRDAVLDSLHTLLDTDGELHAELRPLVVSKGRTTKKRAELRYPFAADLVGNTICADLLDYLRRDHLFTGLPFALGRRFVTAFFIVPSGRGEFERRLALSIVRNGHERTDVVTELLKALRYRYELSERALAHHAKLAADSMLGKMLERWSDAVWLQTAAEKLAGLNEAESLRESDPLAMRRAFAAAFHDEEVDDPAYEGARVHPVDLKVRERLERELMGTGDDGLLEKIAALSDLTVDDPRAQAAGGFSERVASLHHHAAGLATALLNRRLFKVAGRVGVKDAPAEELYERFGDARERSALERDAERFAGLGDEPQVLIWLPKPSMRLKVAEVLVDDGEHIDRFAAYEGPRSRRGSDIYGGHARLWALWVFTHPDLPEASREVVLAYLAERLGVAWERLPERWGTEYWCWVDRLIVSRLIQTPPRDPRVDQLVTTVSNSVPARHAADTFDDRLRRLGRRRDIRVARRTSPGS